MHNVLEENVGHNEGHSEKREAVATQLVSWLREEGIEHVLGVPSGGWLPYMQAMQNGGVEFVLVSNEASAGFMACVYAWLKGVPGVCYATIGPGSTNLSTGVGCAHLNRVPVLSLTGEPPRSMIGRTVQMAVDQQTMYQPLTKATMRLDPARVYEMLDQAHHTAVSGVPGPVNIGLPDDLAVLNGEPRPGNRSSQPRRDELKGPAEAALGQMERAFGEAVRPVLAVGLGAVRNECADLIREIAEKHQVPVVLTPMAKGMLAEDHASYAGVLFHALSDRVAETHQQADLVVGIGYDPVEFNYEAWMPNVKLIHIDAVPADIDSEAYPAVLNVEGAITPALGRLLAMAPQSFEWDFDALAERRKKMFEMFVPDPSRFGPLAVLTSLRERLPNDGIMTCDVGSHTHLIGQMWRTPQPDSQLMDNGWSSMGFGVPSAIGAKLACPDREVACVTGDGGFLMMAGEMATAKRLGLRIVFVLLSDSSLDLIRLKQAKRNMAPYGTSLGPEVGSVGDKIFGVPVLKTDDDQSYKKALEAAFESDGPTIVQAFIDPSEYDGLIQRKHK